MIFDLVRRKKDNRTMIVVDVGYDENIGAITTDDRFYGDFEDYHETQVEPIPITPEFLEKNGFIRGELKTAKELICGTKHICYGFYPDCLSISDWADDGDCQISSLKCLYVHDLQHALKLCRIDKEIEL